MARRTTRSAAQASFRKLRFVVHLSDAHGRCRWALILEKMSAGVPTAFILATGEVDVGEVVLSEEAALNALAESLREVLPLSPR